MKYMMLLLLSLPLMAQAPNKGVPAGAVKAPPAEKLLQLSDRALPGTHGNGWGDIHGDLFKK